MNKKEKPIFLINGFEYPLNTAQTHIFFNHQWNEIFIDDDNKFYVKIRNSVFYLTPLIKENENQKPK